MAVDFDGLFRQYFARHGKVSEDATEEEIEAETKKIAEQYGMDLEMVKKYLPADQVKEQVVREKVIKLVADSATATAPVVETKDEEKKAEAEKTEEK